VSQGTQCERILALLADGKWHLAAEVYRLGCIAHSRIAELRSRGHVIECERCDGEGAAAYRYRLLDAGLTEGDEDRSLGTDKSTEPPSPRISSSSPSVSPVVTSRCSVEPDPWLPPRAHRDAGDHRDAGNYPSPQARGGRALQSSEQLTLTVAA